LAFVDSTILLKFRKRKRVYLAWLKSSVNVYIHF